MLLRVYTALFYLFSPLIVLRLFWKARRLPAYRHRIGERFFPKTSSLSTADVWLHAVSLGEVVAATPLIEAMLARQLRICVTTMTPTGSQQVQSRFGSRVQHHYLPYDLPWSLRRFFQAIKPRLGMIMETELWPNLIDQATRQNIPLILLNARISDKAFPSYCKVRFFLKEILPQFTSIFAQSEIDAQRFIDLGASSQQVSVMGNMKFDLQVRIANPELFSGLRQTWGDSRPVLIAASTHEDEESKLLSILAKLKKAIPDIILLIAPRHPERFQKVNELCVSSEFNTGRRSQPSSISPETDIVVLDSLGELTGFYQVSDYAFVGGSLVPVGGHNVLEPMAVHIPVCCGPFMQNSKSLCAELCNAGALKKVDNADSLADAVIAMHQNPEYGRRQVACADAILEANQGSVKRYMDYVTSFPGFDVP